MFRVKKSIPLTYNEQGYIYFLCRNYKRLPSSMQRLIQETAMETGGTYYKAVMEFLTRDVGEQAICSRHYISRDTLFRAVKRFYIKFAETL